MKKRITAVLAAVSVMMIPTMAGAQETAPESIAFDTAAYMLPAIGETYDAGAGLLLEGEGASEDVIYMTFDESVASVSEEGIITANGYGITTIIASSAIDETVSAAMDVAVFDFYGMYSGVKTIEAMGCDIAVDITLNADGTYVYYRAPLNIQMAGGGEMPELEDEGTFEMTGTELTFTGEELGEFTAAFVIDGEEGMLNGKIPTGGPSTELELVKVPEEEAENETEIETENGTEAE